ncbi:MAG: hypothetical protein AMXMBFR84_31590 [Candidatus Hydrogenedentota bacterium]
MKEPKLVDKRAMTVAGYSDRYTQETSTCIPALWARFGANYMRVPHAVYGPAYGVCFNMDAACSFDYIAGTEVSSTESLPSEFTSIQLPPTRYAIFSQQENIAAIKDIFCAIYKEWIPGSGLVAADAPQVECYGLTFDPATGDGGFEIWIPVQS